MEALSFVDRTQSAGVDFDTVCGSFEKDWIAEVNGAGCALFDADGDGDLDIFFVNGARFPDDPKASAEKPSDALYRNDGGWSFVDVTDDAGLRESSWGCGVAVADIENDGDLDLFVTNLGADQLWTNDGRGHFTEIGAAAGVDDAGWGSSAAFLDYDRDGLVDLFVVRYLVFDRETTVRRGPGSCNYKGQQILCGPVGFPKVAAILYRNLGDGRFEDVSERTGIAEHACYGLGVAVGDYDRDGWLDVYVASDTTENLLFHNLAGERFKEVGLVSGVALNNEAVAQAGMGVEFVFASSPDREDLFVTNYEDDSNTYYRNDGSGFFTQISSAAGLTTPSWRFLGWSCLFADFDFDRDLDLYIAQGHVVPQAEQIASSPGYDQPNRLLLNDSQAKGRLHWSDASDGSGPGLAVSKSSRGAAYGDLDGDGDLDLVVNEIDARATLLESTGGPRGHWLGVRAVGTRSNRAAIGARVEMEAGGRRDARRVQSSRGYASQSELTLRFGLGGLLAVDRLLVEWPTGKSELFEVPGVDRVLVVTEGKGREVSE